MTAAAGDAWLAVLGDSHVRSFAYDLRFLPLFAGPGRTLRWLTEAQAERTIVVLRENLARLDPRRAVLLVLGEPDMRLLPESVAAADLDAAVSACAQRYLAAIDVLAAERPGALCVYNVVPSADAARNARARACNAVLRAGCAARGRPFVDLWARVADATGSPLAPYVADHIHLNQAVAGFVAADLAGLADLPATGRPHAWACHYRFALPVGSETRIWGDAPPLATGATFPRTQLLLALARRLQARIDARPPRHVAILGDAEGGLAHALRVPAGTRITSSDPDPDCVVAARRLAGFARAAHVSVAPLADGEAPPWLDDADLVVLMLDRLEGPAERLSRIVAATRTRAVWWVSADPARSAAGGRDPEPVAAGSGVWYCAESGGSAGAVARTLRAVLRRWRPAADARETL